MFSFKSHGVRFCSINEFNNILETLKDRKFINESCVGKDVGPRVYLWTETSKAYLVYNSFKETIKTEAYKTDLNDMYEDGYLKYIAPSNQHCSAFSRTFKSPKLINDKSEARVQASGIIWTNEKLAYKKSYIYEYDMHLAWLTIWMNCPLPDTSVQPRLNGIVGKNEIGFVKGYYDIYHCGDGVVFEGDWADYIFPIMYCPNLKYCLDLVKKIDAETNKLKRANLKYRFNIWLGSQQNHNDFIRIAVISQSNQKIINLINKYKNKIVFSVTDSLGALEKIPELDNSKDWKIKSEGYMYLHKNNRIYLDENDKIIKTNFRGVPEQHLKGLSLSKFIELTKYINPDKNLYKLDFESRRIINNETN